MKEKIWRKRILVPLWLIQLAAAAIFTIILALLLWAVHATQDDPRFKDDNLEGAEKTVNTVAGIIIAAAIITIIMDIIEIVLAAIHKLKPVAHMAMQGVKFPIWTAVFIYTIVRAVQTQASALSIFLALVLFVACLAQLIYGVVILHRYRKGTLNTKSVPEIDTYELQQQQVKY